MRKIMFLPAVLFASLFAVNVYANDIQPGRWYTAAAEYAIENGILRTDANGDFNPTRSVTRAEFLYALWAIDGRPVSYGATRFNDVTADAVYYTAVRWASANGIAYGVGNNDFAPDRAITREEMAVLFYRYTLFAGIRLAESGVQLAHFNDAQSVSPRAREAMQFAVATRLLIGDGGMITPRNTATRAEAAVILYRFVLQMPSEPTKPAEPLRSLTFGALTPFSGTGIIGHTDGPAYEARFAVPSGLAVDNDGNLIVFDTFNASIRKIINGKAETFIAGSGLRDEFGFIAPFHADGEIGSAFFGRPTAGVLTPDGLFVTDSHGNTVRRINGDNVSTVSTEFNHPTGIAADAQGNLYVTDTLSHTVKKISPDGTVHTFAGIHGQYGHRDGALYQALFLEPTGIAVAPNGDIYIADTGNHVIRRISGNQVTTIAGVVTEIEPDGFYGQGGFADGPANAALFNFPHGIVYADGVLFIADTGNHAVRVLADGIVRTAAGDGEPDVMNRPLDVAYHNGILYIADSLNHRIVMMEVIRGQQ
ncbi:MAG: S-layer homology domain-containing protein [Defluviitaleaceae bacterium]|nr:S-layer homology domain-containing protein [Defluviitaleaceae bacterium]